MPDHSNKNSSFGPNTIGIVSGLLTAVWFYLLSGLMLVEPGNPMTRRVDVLFQADTADYLSRMASPDPWWDRMRFQADKIHPLRVAIWEPLGHWLIQIARTICSDDWAIVFVGRAINAIVGGIGIGSLFWAVQRGSPIKLRVLLILLALYWLFTANVLVAVPDHFGLSNGFLALSFAVYYSGLGPMNKSLSLLLMTVVCSGITITNGLFPWICLMAVVVPNWNQIFTRAWASRAAIGLCLIVSCVVAIAIIERMKRHFESSDDFNGRSKYLTLRIFEEPKKSLAYSLRGLIDPVIGATPNIIITADWSAPMISYEPMRLWPYNGIQSVAAVAWLILLGVAVYLAYSNNISKTATIILFSWIAFNTIFHNIWGDEYFLFSTHWSWALLALVLLSAHRLPPKLIYFLALTIMCGQVYTLFIIRDLLASIT
jgi:hypothetical protein